MFSIAAIVGGIIGVFYVRRRFGRKRQHSSAA
jgi:hypothetical protein